MPPDETVFAVRYVRNPDRCTASEFFSYSVINRRGRDRMRQTKERLNLDSDNGRNVKSTSIPNTFEQVESQN